MAEPVRVFLLDDHEVVRRGLRELLESEGTLKLLAKLERQRQQSPVFRRCGRT